MRVVHLHRQTHTHTLTGAINRKLLEFLSYKRTKGTIGRMQRISSRSMLEQSSPNTYV